MIWNDSHPRVRCPGGYQNSALPSRVCPFSAINSQPLLFGLMGIGLRLGLTAGEARAESTGTIAQAQRELGEAALSQRTQLFNERPSQNAGHARACHFSRHRVGPSIQSEAIGVLRSSIAASGCRLNGAPAAVISEFIPRPTNNHMFSFFVFFAVL